MAAPGRCQEAPGRTAAGKDLPAALTHCCHKKLLLAALEMTGELAPLGSQLEERRRGLAPGFPTISMQSPASIFGEISQQSHHSPAPQDPWPCKGVERMLGPSVWGREGDEMK